MCVIFNLVMEFWIWGAAGFLNPVLIVSLVLLYFSFCSMLVDLWARFDLPDYRIIFFGAFFGMIQETFGNGSAFNEPNFFGVNLINIFLINIIWWGLLQGVLALYFANRVVALEKKEALKMKWPGWALAVGFILFMILARILEKTLPNASLKAYMIGAGITIVFLLIFLFLRIRPKPRAEKIKIIDVVIAVQFVISAIIGFLHLLFGNIMAIYLFLAWSLLLAIIYIIIRLRGRVLVG